MNINKEKIEVRKFDRNFWDLEITSDYYILRQRSKHVYTSEEILCERWKAMPETTAQEVIAEERK